MILRSLEVEGFGHFAEKVQIGSLSPGVNVVGGPNESGKSTLARAIVRGLFDRRNVSGEGAA